MRALSIVKLGVAAALFALTASAGAAPADVRELAPVRVWPGAVPPAVGMPATSAPEFTEDGANPPWTRLVWNVSVPTFQPFLPDPAIATGAAVIVAPGGGFRNLSIDKGGTEVARWLARRGIAAFVLKYRVLPRRPGETGEEMRLRVMVDSDMEKGLPGIAGVADGTEALRLIRAAASTYGIDPHRVGVVGFSAGGHVAGMMALATDPAQRPDFAGLIYGMPFGPLPAALPAANLPFPPGTPKEPWLRPKATPAPGALPPLFLAMAQDDTAVGTGFRAFYDALFAAGYRPEMHLFERGGHGFGAEPRGLTTDHWIDEFGWWLDTEGLTRRR